MRRESTRNPQNNVLIVVEGRSEKVYLSHLKERGANIEIFITECREDPARMIEFCTTKMKIEQIDVTDGDLAYCVMDVDANKREQIIEAQKEAKKKGIQIIISNPCLEVWFMMHCRESPNHSITDDQVGSEWLKYMNSYEKGDDVWKIIGG